MTRTTQQLRLLWSPACQGPWARMNLYGGGIVSVDPLIVDAVRALNLCLVAASYETRRGDTGAYNCRPITGGTNYSLHSYGIALDINWQTNPYGAKLRTDMPPSMVAAIQGIRTKGGVQVWRWGGTYSGNKDAMHFEVVASPAELARGIDPATVPGGKPAEPAQPTEEQELMGAKDEILEGVAALLRANAVPGSAARELQELAQSNKLVRQDNSKGQVFITDGIVKRPIADKAEAEALIKLLGLAQTYPDFPIIPAKILDRIVLAADDQRVAAAPPAG